MTEFPYKIIYIEFFFFGFKATAPKKPIETTNERKTLKQNDASFETMMMMVNNRQRQMEAAERAEQPSREISFMEKLFSNHEIIDEIPVIEAPHRKQDESYPLNQIAENMAVNIQLTQIEDIVQNEMSSPAIFSHTLGTKETTTNETTAAASVNNLRVPTTVIRKKIRIPCSQPDEMVHG